MLFGKSIVTIHDLAYLRIPKLLDSKCVKWGQAQIPVSARRADAIITISNFSKNDIIELLNIPEEKIYVIHHGVCPDFVPIKDKKILAKIKTKYQIKENYILFVGVLQPSKNIVRLIEAFYELKQLYNIPHQLVIAGEKGWFYDEIFKKYVELKLEDNIIFTGYVAHEDMPGLYSGADVFVLPSVFESFGIPVLEAMACGTPVVASNVCALPEIANNAAILVSPHSTQQIAEGIYQVLSNSELQTSLIEKGIKHAREFTWQKTANETLKMYYKLS
jgi:glycosyltransferase involved in cell wall biosynthesis